MVIHNELLIKMFAYECVNLLIFIKVVCFYLMHLYNGLQRETFLGGGVNGTVKLP
jgi:hypothetical protein